jgi:hypothetical protein
MAQPAPKHPAIRQLMNQLAGCDTAKEISHNLCIPAPIGCGGPADSFRDETFAREYRISGLCQKCQDEIFGTQT